MAGHSFSTMMAIAAPCPGELALRLTTMPAPADHNPYEMARTDSRRIDRQSRGGAVICRMHEGLEGGRPTIDRACALVCTGLLAATLTIALFLAARMIA